MPRLWEIYAIRYATHPRMARENFIAGDPHEDATMPLDYYIWALRSEGQIYAIDTGFGEAQAKLRNRTLLKPPAEGLRAIGIEPNEVRQVLMSHLHYDHCGNYNLFPNARFHVQDREMAYCTGRCMCHAYLKIPYELSDVTDMVGKIFAGRVTFHDGSPWNATVAKYNLDRVVDPATGSILSRDDLGPYASSEAVDNLTLKVTLSSLNSSTQFHMRAIALALQEAQPFSTQQDIPT